MIKGMKEGQKRKHHCRGKKQQIIETTARSENAKRIGEIYCQPAELSEAAAEEPSLASISPSNSSQSSGPESMSV
jgi:hypothetical protein